jgi:Ca2+-binding RTX toxin-like protein
LPFSLVINHIRKYKMSNYINAESNTNDNSHSYNWLDIYSELGINQSLKLFANSEDFWSVFNTSFGTGYNSQAQIIRSQWQSQDFSNLPQVEVISSDILGDANGAYAASSNKIYLSDQFASTASSQSLNAVILEEIGHWVDTQVNAVDSPGDEGEIFSALVRGESLSNQQIGQLKVENDHAIIQIQGQAVEIEKAEPIVLQVNTTVDQNDGSSANGLSLRDAILIANANITNDYLIELQGGQTYFLSIIGDFENAAIKGDLDILAGGNTTLRGVGSQRAIIDGRGIGSFSVGARDGILKVLGNANLILDNVTLTQATSNALKIEKDGRAMLNKSAVSNNKLESLSLSRLAGGIVNYGVLTLTDSIISGNTSSGGAGGIYNAGIATITNSIISNNSTGGNIQAGGISNSGGTVTITNTTINDNTAIYYGGGIFNYQGTVNVTNSTIKNNTAGFDGGGIKNYSSGIVNLKSSNVSNNNASDGDGIYNDGQLTISNNSSISLNQGDGLRNGYGSKVSTTITDSLISNNTTQGVFSTSGDITITNSTIKDNGQEGIYNLGPPLATSTINVNNTVISGNGKEGIKNSSIANVTNSTIHSNKDGGFANYGTATITNSVIRDNTTSGYGGGVFNNYGSITIIDTLINNNSASEQGGGFYNRSSTLNTINILNSTISNNSATFGGGIINWGYIDEFSVDEYIDGKYVKKSYLYDVRSNINLNNTTISGNTSLSSGGGIYNTPLGDININNSTITNNTADSNNDGVGDGGGIYNQANGGVSGFADGKIGVKNTIIAGNFDSPNNAGTGNIHSDISAQNAPITGNNYNLIGNLAGASGTIGTGTDIVNPNAKLSPLQNNGGSTLTHALLSGSPAINAGNNSLIPPDTFDLDGDGNKTETLPFDQTGKARIVGSKVDIGAVEFNSSPSLQTLSLQNVTVVEGVDSQATVTVTLSDIASESVTVKYSIIADTAKANLDYTPVTGTLTFAPGQTSQAIAIPILNDALTEANETFKVVLSNPTNASLAKTTAVVTITDTLSSDTTTTLPATVENLTLTGTANINGTGNNGNNILKGNTGNNILTGGDGNDTYRYAVTQVLGTDTIVETATGGIDTVDFTGTTTTVKLNLDQTTQQTVVTNRLNLILSNSIENITGGSSNDTLTGNSLNNTLKGGSGTDVLNGGVGNDILIGGTGNDTLTGGAGSDRFTFNSRSEGIDKITDFSVIDDTIFVSAAGFGGGLVVGSAIAASQFLLGSAATTSSQRFLYEQSTGALFFDRDGTGAIAKIQFATLNTGLSLTNADIFVNA